MTMHGKLETMARRAKGASRDMALLDPRTKRSALLKAADALLKNASRILRANAADVSAARKNGLSAALIDRLVLNADRLRGVVRAVREIAVQADPVGETVQAWTAASGIRILKTRVPLGVIAMIYESRPNVTAEAAALCLKAGNAVILRGGREALRSNLALSAVLSKALAAAGVPAGALQMIPDTDRENIYQLAGLNGLVDLVIARGSETMVREIQKRATVPVLGHGKGVCHVYVDRRADLAKAEAVAFNAKVQRPGVCNAAESLLVHASVAKRFLPRIAARFKAAGVTLKGCSRTRAILPGIRAAGEKDWPVEYLDLAMSVKVVDSLEDAVLHINRYGSGHTDAILTEDRAAAERFLKSVDSAAVFHNVSTRMHDGGVFGLGAEIGISTQKLHARGTMGVRELTTTKYVASGNGQVRK